MNKRCSQAGVALIYVMAVIAAFSLYMLNVASANHVKSNRLALEFTIAQTNSILNAAYSYRAKQEEWPAENDGVCQDPQEFLGFESDDQLTNGWGYTVTATGDCDDDGVYSIIQSVPDQYEAVLQNAFQNVTVANDGVGPEGTVDIIVSVDQNGDSQWFFEHGEMSNRYSNPYEYSEIECDSGEPEYIFGINAICAAWGELYVSDNEGSEYNIGANSGFRMRVEDDVELFYDIYAVYDDVRTVDEVTTVNYYIDAEIREGGYHRYTNNETVQTGDGLRYANESCPIGGPRIKNIVLSWCN